MKHLFHTTRMLCMRFDNRDPPKGGVVEDSGDAPPVRPPHVVFTELSEHMKPKQVSPDFTPFPLPKYDAALGFGPVRLKNIPDIETSRQRMQQQRLASNDRVAYAWPEESSEAGPLQAEHLFDEEADVTVHTTSGGPHGDLAMTKTQENLASDLGGYHVSKDFPYIDRLECQRSVEDLLAQFVNRPQREARTATVLDLASSMHRRTNEEIERMFYELSSIFTPQGHGLRFFNIKVVKFGRPYFVSNNLTTAFTVLIEAATEVFTMEQPERLPQSPSLYIQLLHFLALVKVFQPNLWFSPNPNIPQNRADYSHPRGVNRNIAYQRTGEDLFDFMTSLLRDSAEGEGRSFLDRCTVVQLLDLLGGLAAVIPDGRPEGEVVNPILRNIFKRWAKQGYEIRTVEEVSNLERLYWIMNLINVKCDAVLNALLYRSDSDEVAPSLGGASLATSVIPLRFHPALRRTAVCGPDFFSSVSREKSPSVLSRAAAELHRSFAVARETQDSALQLALAESGMELLMVLPNKDEAMRSARQEGLDHVLLQNIPGLEEVVERIELEASQRAPLSAENLRDIQSFLSTTQLQHRPSYLTQFRGKFVHPIRTLWSDLAYMNALDNVFLLHSSFLEKSASPLVATLHQRGRSGKDALVVTTSCLRALAVQLRYAENPKHRAAHQRAMEIIGYELTQGRMVLVPFTEELLLHDAGTYCEEDLMLWTLAAFFARELPLVKVHTLLSPKAAAAKPYRTLKGEHSPLSTSEDLYCQDAPLLQALRSRELQAVTRCAAPQLPVRDRAKGLYCVNPSRLPFLYRRDKALFDKYHVSARNVAPGFSQGALASDLRGLGFYTPDHPQVPYTPLPESLRKHIPNQT